MKAHRLLLFIITVSVGQFPLSLQAQPLSPEGERAVSKQIAAEQKEERKIKRQEAQVRLHDDAEALREIVIEKSVTREEANKLEERGEAEVVETPTPLLSQKPEADKETVVVKKPITFWFGAAIQYDAIFFNGIMNTTHNGENASESFFRRAKLDMRTHLFDWGETRLEYDVANTKFNDVYLRYIGKRIASSSRVTLGNQKEPFSMDLLNSSKFSTAMERSIATEAFAAGHVLGLQAQGQRQGRIKKFSWALGAFTEGIDREDNLDFSFSGRTSRVWSITENGTLHTGFSLSIRKGEFSKISLRPQAASNRKLALVNFDAKDASLVGLEVSYIDGPLHFKSELLHATYDGGTEDAESWGSYLQLGMFLTGESVRYNPTYGLFGQTLPKKTIAIEAFARASYLDAEDNNQNNRVRTLTIGGNMYIKRNMRVALNYILADLNKKIGNEDRGNELSMRFQYLY